jgi:hypothetical protein
VNGSVHGAHLCVAAQVDCASDGCAAMSGRQLDRQRPSAVVPANATQVGGSKFPAVEMMVSGAHNPSVQVARSDCSSTGTMPAGTQWAPPQAGLHAAKVLGLNTGGPSQGQLSSTGSCDGASQAKLQAPVAAVGSEEVGS